MSEPLTIIGLARLTGADRDAVSKWLALEDLQPVKVVKRRGRDVRFYDPEKALPIIERHRRVLRAKDAPADKASKAAKGAKSWFALKQQQEYRKLKRENDIEDRKLSEEWLTWEDHRKVLSTLVNRLEQVPGKARSEAGLSDAQTAIVQRMIDEARSDAARDVRGMKT